MKDEKKPPIQVLRPDLLELGFGSPFGTRFGTPVITIDTPSILMQTVVEKGDKVDEGVIIITVTSVWYEIIMELMKDPQFAYQMTPRMWEEMVAGLHERTGLFDRVILTPSSGDFGTDIIAEKDGHYGFRIRDQVKRYKPNNPVTANDVKAMLGTLHGDNNTSKVIVTTTGTFAPKIMEDPAIQVLHPYRLELRDGEILSQMLKEYSKNK